MTPEGLPRKTDLATVTILKIPCVGLVENDVRGLFGVDMARPLIPDIYICGVRCFDFVAIPIGLYGS